MPAPPEMLIAAQDNARAAGAVFGRLLFPVLGLVLLVLGLRRRGASQRDPSSQQSRGTALIVIGSVLLAFGVLGILATAARVGSGY